MQSRINTNFVKSHGNCYAPGTVCCDNKSFQCEVGEACNACPKDQKCGPDGCLVSGELPTSHTAATSPRSTPTPSPVTRSGIPSATVPVTSISTTGKPLSSLLGTTPTPPLASTPLSSGPPSPTLVRAVKSFQLRGCFIDSPAGRLLPDGNQVDGGAGMTVEKCIELAASYRFAGVEAGGYGSPMRPTLPI